MTTLTPNHTVNRGEFFTAEYDGRNRTFEFFGRGDDGKLHSFLLDARTKDWTPIKTVRHEDHPRFDA